jgi:DNA-binding response OmpR family regulator
MGDKVKPCVLVSAREHARAERWIEFCPSWVVSRAEQLWPVVRTRDPDLVIAYLSDKPLPGDVALIQFAAQALPVIAVPPRASQTSVVSLLDQGVDDVVPDSISPQELLARCRAILRRTRRALSPIDQSVAEKIDWPARPHLTELFGRLRRAEANLLAFFLQNVGRVVSQNELIDRVFGGNHAPDSALVRVHVAHLRKSLGGHRSALRTLRGQGYVLDCALNDDLTKFAARRSHGSGGNGVRRNDSPRE